MRASAFAGHRLSHQGLLRPAGATPAEIVTALGAMQAQDYASGLWALGVRLPGSTQARIEQALADRTIVRTWPMRGTLHFIPAPDVRWMLQLLTPRIIAGSAGRYRELELTAAVFAKASRIFLKALQGGNQLNREALLTLLREKGIPTTGQRGYHILTHFSQTGLLCLAARSGKQPTFALLEEWIPAAPALDRETSLATLAFRYFTGHGPATLADFVWWSGLKVTDARAGLHSVADRLAEVDMEGTRYWMRTDSEAPPARPVSGHLLPGFDEFLLGYKDRSAMLQAAHAQKIVPGNNGMFLPMLVIGGQIVGTWKRTVKKDVCTLAVTPFLPLRKADLPAVTSACERYAAFLELKADALVPPHMTD